MTFTKPKDAILTFPRIQRPTSHVVAVAKPSQVAKSAQVLSMELRTHERR
jgi:hypothetical protein